MAGRFWVKPVLLIASHSTPQIRRGQIKPADLGTGQMVKKLCRELKTFGIISTKLQKDANWYINSPLRKRAKEIIKKFNIRLVLDVHGRRDDWPRLIDVYPNNNFMACFKASIKNLPIQRFKSNNQLTLSEDLDRTNVPSLEIEIRRDGRTSGTEENEKVVRTIKGIIQNSGLL